jgi:phenylacetate-coenzyme A ligase PaaK-like adenylate-forming protein
MFDDLLYTVPQLFDYELAVEQKEGRDCLHFTIEVTKQDSEVQEGINKAVMDCLVITKNMNTGRMLLPKIELVHIGSLDHSGRAKKPIRYC